MSPLSFFYFVVLGLKPTKLVPVGTNPTVGLFLLEAPGENLFPWIFQPLDAACILSLWFLPPPLKYITPLPSPSPRLPFYHDSVSPGLPLSP
jgi:hypothetical protein